MTAVGGIITLTELGLKLFNIDLGEGVVAGAINGLVTFLGAVWLVIGHIRARSDLKGGLIRK